MALKLKCISSKLTYVAFSERGEPRRVQPGETFTISADEVPKKWAGLVTVVEQFSRGGKRGKVAVTNPAKGAIGPGTSNTKAETTKVDAKTEDKAKAEAKA